MKIWPLSLALLRYRVSIGIRFVFVFFSSILFIKVTGIKFFLNKKKEEKNLNLDKVQFHYSNLT